MSSEESDYIEEDSDYSQESSQDDGHKKGKKVVVKKKISKPVEPEKTKAKKTSKTTPAKPQPKKKAAEPQTNTEDAAEKKPATKQIPQIKPLSHMDDDRYKQLITCTNAPAFSLCYETQLGKVLSIYDGDTMTVVLTLNNALRKFHIRVNGIDTPQIKDHNPEIGEYSKKVRDILIEQIKGRVVKLQCGNFDKYGRLLATVFVRTASGSDINISEFMISNGMAKPYSGKTKDLFSVADYHKVKAQLQKVRLPDLINYPNP